MRKGILLAGLAAGLVLSGSGVNRSLMSLGHSSEMLYLLAQYKVFVGDHDQAALLLRKAANVAAHRHSLPARVVETCPDMHKG